MTLQEIWNQLNKKAEGKLDKPDTEIMFTPPKLRKLLEQVYEQGKRSAPPPKDPEGSFNDLFKGFWG